MADPAFRGAADRPAPALTGLEDVPDELDWDAFSTGYFPGRRRHDLEAISAYVGYKHGRPWVMLRRVVRKSKASAVPVQRLPVMPVGRRR